MITTDKAADKAVETLRKGGTILYPTDTIWGIGCDPEDEVAVDEVYKIKGRPASKQMLLLASGFDMVEHYIEQVPEGAFDLVESTQRPLTIIYPGARNLASGLLGADQTIGIRITDEAFSKTMIERFGKPVVSTSANRSGESYPSSFNKLDPFIKSQVDYIVELKHDQGFDTRSSAIVKLFNDGSMQWIRK